MRRTGSQPPAYCGREAVSVGAIALCWVIWPGCRAGTRCFQGSLAWRNVRRISFQARPSGQPSLGSVDTNAIIYARNTNRDLVGRPPQDGTEGGLGAERGPRPGDTER